VKNKQIVALCACFELLHAYSALAADNKRSRHEVTVKIETEENRSHSLQYYFCCNEKLEGAIRELPKNKKYRIDHREDVIWVTTIQKKLTNQEAHSQASQLVDKFKQIEQFPKVEIISVKPE
jgi:hypothetical protein